MRDGHNASAGPAALGYAQAFFRSRLKLGFQAEFPRTVRVHDFASGTLVELYVVDWTFPEAGPTP